MYAQWGPGLNAEVVYRQERLRASWTRKGARRRGASRPASAAGSRAASPSVAVRPRHA